MRIRIPLIDRLRRHPTGTCPQCEHTTRVDQTYCTVCGYEMVQQTKTDIARMKPI
jgi:predicted amidophosphoribosyltransferase